MSKFVPLTCFQLGGARGAPLPSPFPARSIMARYLAADGTTHSSIMDVLMTDAAQPDEVPWSSILEWTPADTT